MASPFRDGDDAERLSPIFEPNPPPPPLPPAFGYFSQQALRAAPMGFDGGMRPSLEALEIELREERIREEIITRRISQRRMVEEQARREMEMAMAMRMGMGMLPPPSPEEMDFGQRRGFGPHLARRIGKGSAFLPEVEMVEEAPEDIEFGKRDVEFEERERSASLCPEKPGLKMNDKIIPPKLLPTKRKLPAAILGTSISKFPRPAQKEWSCALCQVSATSEEGLNEHLQGKKHQSKASQLAPKKNLVVTELAKNGGFSSSSSALKQMVAPKKKPIAKGERKVVSIEVGGKLHEVMEKGRYLWCWMCKVKGNGKSAMISHLSGKRHLEESKKREASDKRTVENKKEVEAIDEGTSQHEEVVDVEVKKESTEEPEQASGSKNTSGGEE